MDVAESIKAVSSKFLMNGLELQGGGLRVGFSYIYPIILIIVLKLHYQPCQVLSAGLFLVFPPNVLLRVALLNLILH